MTAESSDTPPRHKTTNEMFGRREDKGPHGLCKDRLHLRTAEIMFWLGVKFVS